MNFKLIGTIIVIAILVVVIGGLGYKIVQRTESYKAKEQTYYSPTYNYQPLSFGCAHWGINAQRKELEKQKQEK